jgi:hypothetical protein
MSGGWKQCDVSGEPSPYMDEAGVVSGVEWERVDKLEELEERALVVMDEEIDTLDEEACPLFVHCELGASMGEDVGV